MPRPCTRFDDAGKRIVAAEAKALGARIRAARETAGLTQAALARALGLQRVAVCYWEAGKSRPKPENLARLALALNVTLAALTVGAPPPTPAVTLQTERKRRAGLLRRLAAYYAYADEPLKAVNARVLADLVEHHGGRTYPNFDIPPGDGVPVRFTGRGAFPVGGSPAGECADLGGL